MSDQTEHEPSVLASWQVQAINLPEHGDNPVHTDDGAAAAGFPAALVAGTTVHAYLTHPPAAAWGASWLDHGWSELRLISPVFDNDTVDVVPVGNALVEARVNGEARASLAVARSSPSAPDRPIIEHHPELTFDLADGLGDYGQRAGDDLPLYPDQERAHPATWTSIGNSVTKTFHVDGPWVHVRSAVTHIQRVASNAHVTVASALIDRFDTRAGERVVLDIEISVSGSPVARVEHESIVRLR